MYLLKLWNKQNRLSCLCHVEVGNLAKWPYLVPLAQSEQFKDCPKARHLTSWNFPQLFHMLFFFYLLCTKVMGGRSPNVHHLPAKWLTYGNTTWMSAVNVIACHLKGPIRAEKWHLFPLKFNGGTKALSQHTRLCIGHCSSRSMLRLHVSLWLWSTKHYFTTFVIVVHNTYS